MAARRAALLVVALHGTAFATDQTVVGCANDAELRTDLATMQASGGGTLTFACGGAATIVLSAQLPSVTTVTTIDGGGAVTLSGGNAFRHLFVQGGATLTLRGITIANALSATDGGAIQSFGTLVIEDSRFQGNQSTGQSGGAILSTGPLTVRRSTFTGNGAVNGGALYPRFSSSIVTIEDSVFENNQARGLQGVPGLGGAILAWDGAQVTVDRTRFAGNSALTEGGAYFNTSGSRLTVRRSSFAFNASTDFPSWGGAIRNSGAAFATIDATLFQGNRAGFGAAIHNLGNVDIVNSTFSGDSGTAVLRNHGTATLRSSTFRSNSGNLLQNISSASMSVRNTVIDAPAGVPACDGTISSLGFNASTDATCSFDQTGDRSNQASGLGPLEANGGPTLTHHPSSVSALVDAGTVVECPGVDQRGRPRPVGVSCDIGAVELGTELFADGFE